MARKPQPGGAAKGDGEPVSPEVETNRVGWIILRTTAAGFSGSEKRARSGVSQTRPGLCRAVILESRGRLGLRVCGAKNSAAGKVVRRPDAKRPCARGAPAPGRWDDGWKMSELYIRMYYIYKCLTWNARLRVCVGIESCFHPSIFWGFWRWKGGSDLKVGPPVKWGGFGSCLRRLGGSLRC
jgi:hypothetical protein